PDNRSLFKMLSKLKKRRAIEELPGGRYRLPSRKSERSAPIQKPPQNVPRHIQTLASHDEITGRLVLHHDGYGFVVPDSPMPQLDGDVFIPRDAIQDAMHGDHVLAKIQRLGGVTGAQRAEGRILRILDRAHPTVVGLFRYGASANVVLPYDVRIPHEIEIPRGNELTPGLWKKLGFSGADETSIRSRRIPRLDELDDDVVYVEHRAEGGWHLQVHIADVAHYVRTQTALDREARLRGTSVYFPDRAVPMLPEALSNGMCSLKPREDRLVMSALMEFDAP